METTFSTLITPLQGFLEQQSSQIDKESGSRKLMFAQFTLTVLYSLMMQIESLRKITNHLELSETAQSLGLKVLPWTTLRDGFTRFSSDYFMQLYRWVVAQTPIFKIGAFDEIGLIRLVDGSLFPTIISMCWAEYKKTKNAIRLHVEFDLNHMIPLEFSGLSGNSSERTFLLTIIQRGITYIADRGYFSFEVANTINQKFAFFIFRIRNNMKIETGKILTPSGKIPSCLENVTDQLIRFTNDPHQKVYRLICFNVQGSEFQICTNRIDLMTTQVIMLYAYRWQIELLFKFIKRTLKGLKLFNHSKNGVNIQFCCLMILAVLYLNLKQFCKKTVSNVNFQSKTQVVQTGSMAFFNNSDLTNPEKWVNSINQVFKEFWKISSYWVENIKVVLHKPFDNQIIRVLAAD